MEKEVVVETHEVMDHKEVSRLTNLLRERDNEITRIREELSRITRLINERD